MDGCRCSQCWSLREYMLRLTGKDYGLPAAPGHAPGLSLVEDPCDGSYCCECAKCRAEVRELIARKAA